MSPEMMRQLLKTANFMGEQFHVGMLFFADSLQTSKV